MKCPDCQGFGKYRVLAKPLEGPCFETEMKCSLCKGKGEITEEQASWVTRGEALRDKRLAMGLSLREFCKQRNMSPVEVSQMERGKIEPTDYEEEMRKIEAMVKGAR